ncbi:hypothetical protein STEG23_010292 [Scotinomys teguina]
MRVLVSLAVTLAAAGGSSSGSGGGFRSPAAKMLKVTVPSCSSSSCSSVTSSGPGSGNLVPDYWIDGSNRDSLSNFFEVESELGRLGSSRYLSVRQLWLPSPRWSVGEYSPAAAAAAANNGTFLLAMFCGSELKRVRFHPHCNSPQEDKT